MKKLIPALMFVFFGVILIYFWPTEYDDQLSLAIEKKEKNPNITVFDGEVEPPLPNSWENNKTLLGVDANKNGIRDDLDIIINRNFEDYNERMAIRQYVRTFPKWFEACEKDIRDSSILNPINRPMSKAEVCMGLIMDHKNTPSTVYSLLVRRLVLNNNLRKSCADLHQRYVTSYGPIGGPREREADHCDFKIKDEDRVVKRWFKYIFDKWGGNK